MNAGTDMQVKGNTPLERISSGLKQLTELLAAIREPPQDRNGPDVGNIKPREDAQFEVKGASGKLMEAVRSSPHLMPGRKANLMRVYRRDDQARLKQAAKVCPQLHFAAVCSERLALLIKLMNSAGPALGHAKAGLYIAALELH